MFTLDVLPPPKITDYADAGRIFAGLAPALRWADIISVSETAEKHRILENPGGGYSGPWLNEMAPHLVRPMDCLSAGKYQMVAVQGPAQSGKSEIPNNWLLQSVLYDPATFIWLQSDKAIMRSYVLSRIDEMIRLSPDLAKRIVDDRSSDGIWSKHFLGMWVWFTWPVASQLQMHPAPRFVIDDYDRVPEDIDEQGDALSLLEARQTTFEGSEVAYVGSSPSLGDKKGIEGLVNLGTNERFHWLCSQCGEPFAPDTLAHLIFDHAGTPADAKNTAIVKCPTNGCVIEQREKPSLMAAGDWLGPDQVLLPDGSVEGDLTETSIASFRIDGLMGFSSWGRLAELWRRAELTFELRQDEYPLRTFTNTRAGKNYRSKVEGQEPLTAEELEDRRTGFVLGEVAAPVRCLTAAVDVQHDRFEVEVKGWGEGFESWIVDRFAIHQLEDGRTKVNPAKYPEHWGVLLRRVIWRRYTDPAGVKIPILTTTIDTGGIEGVSPNASAFWHTARKAGVPEISLTLVKGGNQPRARTLPAPTFLEFDSRGRSRKGGPRLWVPNVNRIKDILALRFRREDPGPGFIHIPADLDPAYLAEIAAEEKKGLYWEKVAARNETLDLEVYNYTGFLRIVTDECSFRRVPGWALRDPDQAATDGSPPGPPASVPADDDPPPVHPVPAPALSSKVEVPQAPADHPHRNLKPRRRRGNRGRVGG